MAHRVQFCDVCRANAPKIKKLPAPPTVGDDEEGVVMEEGDVVLDEEGNTLTREEWAELLTEAPTMKTVPREVVFGTWKPVGMTDEVPEVVPAVPAPMPTTCKFFTAAAIIDGVEASDLWEFDKRPKAYHGCSCPELNAKGQTACEYSDNQTDCYYFEPSAIAVVDRKRVTTEEGQVVVSLEKARYNLGQPCVQVFVADVNDEGDLVNRQVVHTVTYETHPDDAMETAQTLMAETVAGRGGTEDNTTDLGPLVVEGPKPPSYLKGLLV